MIMLPRRTFITGLVALVAAPAIVRASNIMPVKSIITDLSLVPLPEITGNVFGYDLLDLRDYHVRGDSFSPNVARTVTPYRKAVADSGIDDVDGRWKRLVERQKNIIERGVIYV